MNLQKKLSNLTLLDDTKIPVIIEKSFLDKVKFLCKKIPYVEWSGVLFYSVKGTIKDLSSFSIKLEDIFFMDKGTSAYTSYELDEALIDYRMSNPKSMNWFIGHIHSHNSMPTFFSNTDDEELIDNSPYHNFYLSVITNNYQDFKIKLSFNVKFNNPVSLDENGDEYEIKKLISTSKIYYFEGQPFTEEKEIIVDKDFENRFNEIIKLEKSKNKKSKSKELKLKFDEEQESVDEYYGILENFFVDALNVHLPSPQTKGIEETIKTIINVVHADIEFDYVTSTVSSMYDTYSAYFKTGKEFYVEDLIQCIDWLESDIDSPVISSLYNELVKHVNNF